MQPSDQPDDLMDLDVYFDKQSDWRDSSSSAAAAAKPAPAQRGSPPVVGGGGRMEGDGERWGEKGGAEKSLWRRERARVWKNGVGMRYDTTRGGGTMILMIAS